MNQRGFTLIEVLLAASIMALVMGLLFSTFFGQARSDRAARSEMDTDQAARVVMEQIGRDVAQLLSIKPPTASGAVVTGRPLMVGNYPGHELSLVTRAGLGREGEAGGAEPVVRTVYLTELPGDEKDGPLILTRRERSLLEDREGLPEVLCRRVAGLRFFYSGVDGVASEKWDEPSKELVQVRIELMLTAPDGRLAVYEYSTGPLVGLKWKGKPS